MKKWLFPFAFVATLAGCSVSNESKQQANDSYQKSDAALPLFAPLNTAGVSLPKQDTTYQLPQVKVKKADQVDIRPPETPLAIIQNSIAQFDGERALIAYPIDKREVYNLQQVARLLKEQGIGYQLTNEKIVTDWAPTGRADEIGDTQVRYEIEQVSSGNYSALFVSILQMKRNEVVFSPHLADKQRYSSDRLNQLVGELDASYRKQVRDLNNSGLMPIQSVFGTDSNGRTALVLGAPFNHAWTKLGQVLPQLEFDIKDEIIGRGVRELKYRPAGAKSWWWPFGRAEGSSGLKTGTYFMQLSALGKQSAVVITDDDGNALSGEQAQALYQALQNLLAK
ncbi:outer membrane protein assembly factor BamC [Pasteurella multocida]|uniref:outer membrane protein assembly factor BamC n=1 Tax=Pasteurella multocida TaxID=747 RepID=UPI002A50135D|nr:outer membrane protein assembly factor BamC [Pasteurella multocida]MDY0488088.1 outer membrane protein assembly factor BamC [Pasteurella multocida]MDY0594644.1 outer membrane protein assembly factor BamC [Pasteurella multocida]MDY0664077.1 outer membrane protein assembly factor BamC [Pasteurella multocida]MDY0666175.1 outer membrane protein assembly factor BamC [Pasteurella multocida]